MDGDRFDTLTRLLGQETTRRGATITGTILTGAGLARFQSGSAGAKGKKKKKKTCKPQCIAPQAKCTNKCHKCCPDSQGTPRVCELVPVCPESADGKYCCGKEGVECSQDCDCCGDLECSGPAGHCCVGAGTVCDDTTACCGACEGGECCTLADADCWEDEDCCFGLTCEGVVQQPLTPGKCV